jgi:hypothetical protein
MINSNEIMALGDDEFSSDIFILPKPFVKSVPKQFSRTIHRSTIKYLLTVNK